MLSFLKALTGRARRQPQPPATTAPPVMVLTGAGVSRASGLPTFRDADGLWHGVDVWKVASPEGFRSDPDRLRQFYDERRREAAAAEPNAAHRALAAFERAWPGEFLLVTQNVDGLHEAAGSRRVRHVHGSLSRWVCAACGAAGEQRGDMAADPGCPSCNMTRKRPDVVWFGEKPRHLDEVFSFVDRAPIFLAVGCSLEVGPVNKLPSMAWRASREPRVVEVNPAPTRHPAFNEVVPGPAEEALPGVLDAILARYAG